MKLKNYLLTAALLLMSATLLLAQKEKAADKKTDKEYIVVKEIKGDKDQKKTTRIVVESKDGNVFIKGEDDLHLEGDDVIIIKEGDIEAPDNAFFFDSRHPGHLNVNVNENNGEKHIVIEFKNENGEEQRIEWEGEGEPPAHIRKYLHKPRRFEHKDWKTGVFELHEDHAFLGVVIADEETETIEIINGEKNIIRSGGDDSPGVQIQSVVEESAAAEAGLQADDVIMKIDDQAIQNFSDLRKTLNELEPGDEINIQYQRGTENLETKAVLKTGQAPRDFTFEWQSDEDKDFNFAPDGEHIFIHRAQPSGHKYKIIIVERKGKDEENAPVAPVPDLDLERSLELKTFEAYPNPSSGQFQLKFESAAAPLTIRLTNLQGKQIYREYIRDFNGLYNESMDLNNLSSGIYILSIEQEGKIFSEQMVIK